MDYKTLPGTALTVSTVCLGTMTWGEQNTEAQAHEQLEYATAHGINFIDTAEMYPIPPNAAPRDTPSRSSAAGSRASSATGWWWRARSQARAAATGSATGAPTSRAGVIAEACDTSLARLQTDYLDLFQIHWPQRNVPTFGVVEFDPARERAGPSIEEQVQGMAALVKAGKIRHYGLSNETTWGVCEFQRVAKTLGVPGPVTLQNSYSLVSRGADHDLAEALFREQMSLLAYSPLAAGMLSGKYRGGKRPPGCRHSLFADAGARYRKPIVQEAIEAYAALAERHGITLVQLALGYVRSRWHVGATIIGATSMEQLAEDIAAAQFDLDAGTVAEIADIQLRFPNPAT